MKLAVQAAQVQKGESLHQEIPVYDRVVDVSGGARIVWTLISSTIVSHRFPDSKVQRFKGLRFQGPKVPRFQEPKAQGFKVQRFKVPSSKGPRFQDPKVQGSRFQGSKGSNNSKCFF